MGIAANPSDLIAALALAVSIGSVFYARASVRAAAANNRIGLHQPRKAIYDGLLHFRSLFVGMDFHPNAEEIDAFYVASVAPAQIYLGADLAKKIQSVYERSWALFRRIDAAESEGGSGESKWVPIELFQSLGRTELEEVIRSVTERIHVGNT
jgi:hypothetical protein